MLLLFRQYFEFMVHFRTIQFGVFLYFFPRKYPTYLLALLRTSGAINQGFPSLQTYLAIFLPATFLHLRKDILQIILDTVPETPPDSKVPVVLLFVRIIMRMDHPRFSNISNCIFCLYHPACINHIFIKYYWSGKSPPVLHMFFYRMPYI